MALADHYRVLGLRTGASFGDVKLAYRNLARLYHPDVNPGDQRAKDKFIQVTQAYRALSAQLPHSDQADYRQTATTVDQSVKANAPSTSSSASNGPVVEAAGEAAAANDVSIDELQVEVHPVPGRTAAEQDLKLSSFHQLRSLFKDRRFPRAVALVEGLVSRFPDDPEIRQWHAITYYRWGHDLLNDKNLAKAKACLQKALRVDPQNKSLQQALARDFQRLEALTRAQEVSPPPGQSTEMAS